MRYVLGVKTIKAVQFTYFILFSSFFYYIYFLKNGSVAFLFLKLSDNVASQRFNNNARNNCLFDEWFLVVVF